MRKAQLMVSALLLFVLLLACTPKGAPVPALAPQIPAPQTPAPTKGALATALAQPAWEVKWENAVVAAKGEGKLAFATSAGGEARRTLSEAFKGKYGIRMESMGATAAVIMPKILAERRAGIYLWDVLVAGTSAHITIFKPGGATSPLEPALTLPDLTDPEVIKKVWYDGQLPWIDRDRHQIGGLLYVETTLAINTDLVKPGEIKSFDDLLNPKWKGKILLTDPTIPGTMCDASVMPMLYGIKGEDWVRKLAAQEPVIMADERLQIDWLARGKYPISMPARPYILVEFRQAGAPIKQVSTEDVQTVAVGSTGVSLIDKAPHPNAAKVFLNWYLGKEALTIMSKAFLGQSARLDVPTDFLAPEAIRQAGRKYYVTAKEEVLLKVPDYRKKSNEIFGHLIKK